ncbi:MAG: outer membrane protein assembly factor BamD [Proteobacteria bacterium]|nr:outer membrane protein assembly factor BamD [Pseudomonadota bacterium]
MTIRLRYAIGLLAMSLAASGCSSGGSLLKDVFNRDKEPKVDIASSAMSPSTDAADEAAVAELYNGGLEALNRGSWSQAQKKFADVERKHPYSKWATKAILMQAFAAYSRNSYDDAINAADRFISLHPGHKDAPYAYYIKALSDYERISDVRRDQSRTSKAVDALEEVAQRFPDSKYAADAKQKALLARDRLAAKEMEIGRFYAKRGAYTAAINRFRTVVELYQTSTHTPEALYRLAESYLALGIRSEAQTAAAVLGYNFPNSQWYKDAYTLVGSDGQAPVASESSWISRAFSRARPSNG